MEISPASRPAAFAFMRLCSRALMGTPGMRLPPTTLPNRRRTGLVHSIARRP